MREGKEERKGSPRKRNSGEDRRRIRGCGGGDGGGEGGGERDQKALWVLQDPEVLCSFSL